MDWQLACYGTISQSQRQYFGKRPFSIVHRKPDTSLVIYKIKLEVCCTYCRSKIRWMERALHDKSHMEIRRGRIRKGRIGRNEPVQYRPRRIMEVFIALTGRVLAPVITVLNPSPGSPTPSAEEELVVIFPVPLHSASATKTPHDPAPPILFLNLGPVSNISSINITSDAPVTSSSVPQLLVSAAIFVISEHEAFIWQWGLFRTTLAVSHVG